MKHLLIIAATSLILACSSSPSNEEKNAQNEIDMKNDKMEFNKEKVNTFFQLLEDENIEAFVDMFAEDGYQINPYASSLFPSGASGHEELMNYWKPVPGNFDGMEFILEDLLGTEDPNMVFVKYTGKIRLKDNAGFYENQYYSTFKFNEQGKIKEYVEIFNPITAARAFGLTDSIQ